MIKFKTIEIIGFGSIQGPFQLNFNKRGLIIIRGDNGVGKTTILSALVWCIYKVLIKKGSSVTTWEHKRPKDYKGTKVTLEFTKDKVPYKIIRCMDYTGKVEGLAGKNRVFLYREDKLTDEKGTKDTNGEIARIMGMSSDLFCSSILFGQKMKRLIEEDGPKKKQVLEEAFETTYINKAQDLAKKKREKLNTEYIKEFRNLTALNSTITAKTSELENLQNLETDFENRQTLKLNSLKNELAELRVEIGALAGLDNCNLYLPTKEKADLQSQLSENLKKQASYKTPQASYDRATNLRNTVKADMEKLSALVSQLNISNLCFNCGAEMDKETRAARLQEACMDLATKQIALKDINQAILGHKKELASLLKLQSKYDTLDIELKKVLDNIRGTEAIIAKVEGKEELYQRIKLQIKAVKAEKANFNTDELRVELESLQAQQRPLSKHCSQMARRLKVLDWLISVPLSNSGLKVFIFNQMIQRVNARLQAYSSYIGFTPRFEVDLTGARKDINMVVYDGKYPVPYQDLSGGQSQLINIVTAFSIHDIVSDGSINLLFLDEVFESLSSNNVEVVGNIISQKSQDKAIYLITHLQDFIAQTTDILQLTTSNSSGTSLL